MKLLEPTLDRVVGDLDDLHTFDYITAREACRLYEHITPTSANQVREAWRLMQEAYPKDEVRAALKLERGASW